MSLVSASLLQRGWVQEVETNSFETISNEVKSIESFRRYKHYANRLRDKITPARKRSKGTALLSRQYLKDDLKQIITNHDGLLNDKKVARGSQSDIKAVPPRNKGGTKGKVSSVGLGYRKSSKKIPTSISKAPDLLTVKWGTPFYGERLGPFKMDKDGYFVGTDAITPVDTAAWVHDEEYGSIYSKYNLGGDETPLDWAQKVTSTNHLFQIDSIVADARLIGNSWSNMLKGLSNGFYSSKEGLKTFSTDLAWASAITTSHTVLIGIRALSAGVGFITNIISGALTGLAGAAERNMGVLGKGIGYVLRGVDKVLSAAVGVTRAVIGIVGGAAMAVTGAVGLAVGYIAGKAIEFGAAIVDTVGDFVSDLGSAISNGLDTVGDFVGGAAEAVGDFIGGAAEAVGDFIGGAAEAIGDFIGGVGDAIGDAVDAVGDFLGGDSDASAESGEHNESSEQDHDTGGEGRDGGGDWCFITGATLTSIGGIDSRYELELLRTFRDTYVINRGNGIFLIREYYVVAKEIVLKINQEADSQTVYKGIYNDYLKPALNAIEKRHYLRALKLYEDMVNDLSNTFGISKPMRLPVEPINRYTALAA